MYGYGIIGALLLLALGVFVWTDRHRLRWIMGGTFIFALFAFSSEFYVTDVLRTAGCNGTILKGLDCPTFCVWLSGINSSLWPFTSTSFPFSRCSVSALLL